MAANKSPLTTARAPVRRATFSTALYVDNLDRADWSWAVGPLFSILLVLVAGTLGTVASFLVGLFFLPPRISIVFAPLVVAAGAAGCLLAVMVQFPFVHGTIPAWEGMCYLAVVGVTGCGSAALTGRAFVRWHRGRQSGGR